MASSNIIILKARYTSIYILYLIYTKKFVNDLMLKKILVALFWKAKNNVSDWCFKHYVAVESSYHLSAICFCCKLRQHLQWANTSIGHFARCRGKGHVNFKIFTRYLFFNAFLCIVLLPSPRSWSSLTKNECVCVRVAR